MQRSDAMFKQVSPRLVVMALSVAFLSATGCAAVDADDMARSGGLKRGLVTTDSFVLTSFSRFSDPNGPVDIYIEGDGMAWKNRTQPSMNPTPRQALGLALAGADSAANVVYLARPCQFTAMAMNPRCEVSYWTGKRYAPEIIASMDQAISQVADGRAINLIGYSGGGAVAVLVAARRPDIVSIRTVAGNLDHDEVNRIHEVSPMPLSLNAMAEAQRVASIPQVHFSGDKDKVVPPAIAERFRAASSSRCVRTRVVAGLAHDGDWPAVWPSLLLETPRCE